MIDPRTNESGNKIYRSKFKSMAMIKSVGNLEFKPTKTFLLRSMFIPSGFPLYFSQFMSSRGKSLKYTCQEVGGRAPP